MRELPSSIRVLMNLYEVGLQGYCRTSSYVVSTGGVSPAIRAREQGDIALIVEDETPEIAEELHKLWKEKRFR